MVNLDSQSFGLLETCLLTMESRLTNTDGCLEYQIELEESMAYMHQCSLFGDSRSILLRSSRLVLANQKSFFRKQLRKLRRKGKPISIFSHPSLTTLVEFLVNEVSLDRTSRESTIGSLNTLTQSFSVSCLNILDIIAAVSTL